MTNQHSLSEEIISDIKKVGTGSFIIWLSENKFKLPKNDNFFDGLQAGLEDNSIELNDIFSALAELEENSDKKIFLYQLKGHEILIQNRKQTLFEIRQKFGYYLSPDNTIRLKPGEGPTFGYLNIDDSQLKLKFSETHFDREDDLINDRIIRIPKVVNIFLIIELESGFAQLRMDTSGQIHTHRNDLGKPSELAFQMYYKDLITKIFSEISFDNYNLNGVSNHIAQVEKERFLMRKNVTTITDGAKMIYSTPRKKADVRFLKAFVGAEATDEENEWITEDFSGYWVAEHSKGELKQNLFMRIYRRDSEIRVQRGCLKKELDYGIKQIREIQEAI